MTIQIQHQDLLLAVASSTVEAARLRSQLETAGNTISQLQQMLMAQKARLDELEPPAEPVDGHAQAS